MTYPNAIQTLESDLKNAPQSPITDLAARLITAAKQFDLDKTAQLAVNFRMDSIQRSPANPPDYTHESILGAPYADDEQTPLAGGEAWHQGRRASNTGLKYSFNNAGRPINPFMNTGLNGRGVLGQFGPNHAVDNGIIRIKTDENGDDALHVIGILRKFDNDAPALCGGFAKYARGANGEYIFDKDAVIETQLEELFEEMISGSIALNTKYAGQLPQAIQDEYDRRMQGRNGLALSDHHKAEIAEQIKTGLKMAQVEENDPEFLKRLHGVIAGGHECFAGPILNDNRNTNNAWIETKLTWFTMDDATWRNIVGLSPKYNYAFSAGDDASGVIEHHFSPTLIKDAFASHGALFSFIGASYLLKAQETGTAIAPSILKQCSEIVRFLDAENTLHAQQKQQLRP
jgi:hypothetical protein|tara:strand:- start:146913 stop:148115 length:1203 start_codon:yes stop_codon:yes gene_type:complete